MFSTLRLSEIAVSTFLLLKAFMQYAADPDWWIYVPIYSLGAVLCLIQIPKNGIWRLLSALVIVTGALHVVFIAWSIRHASSAVLSEQFDEGRHILATATAVVMVTNVRLYTAQYNSVLAYLRTLILIVVLLSTIPSIAFSLCFYSTTLPYCPYLY
ncbi:hypothetical protein Tcan_09754 [Toxocara canis]|uniref:Transmembrane protein n=1 Tax=Toxocara canis TaxID=6265 RepID=A0A0B2VAA0_TOXCA|nr:hypothetical protein Tcan_09754 [Toxocara canis]